MGPGSLFPALRVQQPRVELQRRCLFERAELTGAARPDCRPLSGALRPPRTGGLIPALCVRNKGW